MVIHLAQQFGNVSILFCFFTNNRAHVPDDDTSRIISYQQWLRLTKFLSYKPLKIQTLASGSEFRAIRMDIYGENRLPCDKKRCNWQSNVQNLNSIQLTIMRHPRRFQQLHFRLLPAKLKLRRTCQSSNYWMAGVFVSYLGEETKNHAQNPFASTPTWMWESAALCHLAVEHP